MSAQPKAERKTSVLELEEKASALLGHLRKLVADNERLRRKIGEQAIEMKELRDRNQASEDKRAQAREQLNRLLNQLPQKWR